MMAARAIESVLRDGHALDPACFGGTAGIGKPDLAPRDRAFARLLTTTVLRHAGALRAVVGGFLTKPLSERNREVETVLMLGAAQLLYLDTPPHAAISLAVEHCRRVRGGQHLDKLVNAVLRRVAAEGKERLAALDPVRTGFPPWMLARWTEAYGEADARRIALASLQQAPLDISIKARAEAEEWARRLDGALLATGTVRLASPGRVDELAGFAEGAWWVQDAAAALPACLLGDVAGSAVADLCAAPGGKTAELAAAGARVTAVDISDQRARRIAENLSRLGLAADIVVSDILDWNPPRTFDAVLLDAPCTATGTIRRHPDILYLKREGDIEALTALQAAMIDRAQALVRPGGLLVYCTCSLEPEEGIAQIETALRRHPALERVPVEAQEAGGAPELVTPAGDLRTLPFHRLGPGPAAVGMDGFFAARLRKRG